MTSFTTLLNNDDDAAFFSNIERVLVSSVLHIVCKMYDNLSYSVDLTGLLALRLCCASLVSQARRRDGFYLVVGYLREV